MLSAKSADSMTFAGICGTVHAPGAGWEGFLCIPSCARPCASAFISLGHPNEGSWPQAGCRDRLKGGLSYRHLGHPYAAGVPAGRPFRHVTEGKLRLREA